MSENDAPERIWISKYSGQRVRASEGALVDGIQEYVRADLAAPDAAQFHEHAMRAARKIADKVWRLCNDEGEYNAVVAEAVNIIKGEFAVQPAASTPTLEDILRERQAVGAVTMVGDVNITAAASTEVQGVTHTDDENVERWRSTMIDRDTTVATTTPDFTENAKQVVREWLSDWVPPEQVEEQIDYRLVKRVASFASEAATQGQSVGIERARQKVVEAIDSHIARWRMLDDEVELWKVDSLRTELTAEIHQMSPDPDYLDRVRSEAAQQAAKETAEAGLYNEDGSYTLNAKVIAGRAAEEAATAALEQAVQVAEDYFTLKGNVWVEKYGNVKLEDAIRAIAAIGDET